MKLKFDKRETLNRKTKRALKAEGFPLSNPLQDIRRHTVEVYKEEYGEYIPVRSYTIPCDADEINAREFWSEFYS